MQRYCLEVKLMIGSSNLDIYAQTPDNEVRIILRCIIINRYKNKLEKKTRKNILV